MDEEQLAESVGRGRTPAARAIRTVIAGKWPVTDPLNIEPTSFLVSTFRFSLNAEARAIFREALSSLLQEYGEGRMEAWSSDELSTLMYVAREVSLADRLRAETRHNLTSILNKATERADTEVEGLALKYLAAEHLLPSMERWRSLYEATGRRHPYICFMGMATIDPGTKCTGVGDP